MKIKANSIDTVHRVPNNGAAALDENNKMVAYAAPHNVDFDISFDKWDWDWVRKDYRK